MNSNNVVFNKSPDVVFRDTTDVVFRIKEKLGIKEIKGSDKRDFIMVLCPCAPGLVFSQI